MSKEDKRMHILTATHLGKVYEGKVPYTALSGVCGKQNVNKAARCI